MSEREFAAQQLLRFLDAVGPVEARWAMATALQAMEQGPDVDLRHALAEAAGEAADAEDEPADAEDEPADAEDEPADAEDEPADDGGASAPKGKRGAGKATPPEQPEAAG